MAQDLEPVFANVVAYYDTHPIHEAQIRAALAERGVAWDTLTQAQLQQHDQDHYGGLEANDALIAAAGICAGHRVLDVCCGLGGPARYVAHVTGCEVVGLDLTRSRYESAQRLTQQVGLEGRVRFELGNALAMPFPDGSFDVVMGQEAWCHVPDKPRLIAECVRVAKPGGTIAFTDVMRRATLTDADHDRLAVEMTFPALGSFDEYRMLLQAQGCTIESSEDLSAAWTRILVARLAMYRSLGDHTRQSFGEGRREGWDQAYSFFVDLFEAGRLGGGRVVARKPAAG